jgi:type IV secretion system protein VirB6
VFGLVPSSRERERASDGPRAVPAPQPAASAPRGAVLTPASAALTPRRVAVAPMQTVIAANDTGGEGGVSRETRVVTNVAGAAGQAAPLAPATARTRGIGNRFRSAGAAPQGTPANQTTPPPETYQ